MTERQRATELKVGETYSRNSGATFTTSQVMGPADDGWWYCLDLDGHGHGYPPDNMPLIATPEPTQPAPRFEWRKVEEGDQFVHRLGGFITEAEDMRSNIGQYRWVFVPEGDNARP